MSIHTIIKNKKIALLGLGLENKSLLQFLSSKNIENLDITVCDLRELKTLQGIIEALDINIKVKYRTESKFNTNLYKFDLLFRSPGWPIACPGIQEALSKGSKLTSAMNIFFEICPSKNIIGVTGSKGKGTTSSLIHQVILESGQKSFLGGNIGIAPLSFVKKIKKNDYIVLELSSFQLEDLRYSPKIAVITNLFEEHLSPADPNNPNFHKDIHKYFKAKMKIASHQKSSDHFIANYKIKDIIQRFPFQSNLHLFTKSKLKTIMAGEFNLENIAAVEEVVKILKINKKYLVEVLKSFSNLEHRLELVREINKVKYYDNSFSTTPESTIADLKSFKKNIILIAGGADKGAYFVKLAEEIKKRVKFITLFPGKGSDRIKKELNYIKFPKQNLKEVKSMKEAVKIAGKEAKSKDVVLLSTACASFGIFKNYKERGDLFKEEVKKL